jgi:hypothetical protein
MLDLLLIFAFLALAAHYWHRRNHRDEWRG